MPPADLSGRIVTAWQGEQRRVFRARQVRWALAASVLIAAAGYALWPTMSPSPSSGVPVLAQHKDDGMLAVSLSLDPGVQEASSALAALVESTARATGEPSRWHLPETVAPPPLADLDSLQQVLEPPTQSLRLAGQNVTTGLEPVASSARRAVVAFLEDLPPMGQEQ
jgi:hypothetical protein